MLSEVQKNHSELVLSTEDFKKKTEGIKKSFGSNPRDMLNELNGPNGANHVDAFLKYMNWGAQYTLKVESYISNVNKSNMLAIAYEMEARKAERKDIWILWIQKSFRWCVGVVLAVALYSSLVNFSETYPKIIHIPVRDLIISK